jgi:hypothetical protein
MVSATLKNGIPIDEIEISNKIHKNNKVREQLHSLHKDI